MTFLSRLIFAVRYRTLGRFVRLENDPTMLLVYHRGSVARIKRRCPHQGAPLETGYFDGDDLVCPWHGCRFKIKNSTSPQT